MRIISQGVFRNKVKFRKDKNNSMQIQMKEERRT